MNYIENVSGRVSIRLDSGLSFSTDLGFASITQQSNGVHLTRADGGNDIILPAPADYIINGVLQPSASPASLMFILNGSLNKISFNTTFKEIAKKILSGVAAGGLPVAMAAPPTISQAAAPTISGQAVAASDIAFQYFSTSPFLSGSFMYAYHVERGGYKTGGHMDVYFSTDAPAFEIMTAQTENIRIFVDGLAVSLTPIALGTNFSTTYIKVDFTTSAQRSIRIEVAGAAPFGGVRIANNYSIWRSEISANNLRLIITGDSYVDGGQGDGSFSRLTGFSRQLGYRLGIKDCFISGKAGEKYSDLDARKAYDIITFSPNYIIIAEGINDLNTNTAALQSTVTNFYAALLAALPNAIITVVAPWRAPAYNPSTAVYNAIKNGVLAQAAAITSGQLMYIDTLADNWQQLAGKVGAVSGAGNSNIYTGADGIHPVQAGHDYLGYRTYLAALKHLTAIQ